MNTVRFEEMAVKTYAGPERASGEYDVARGLVEACREFVGHYPRGINPFLDEAYVAARKALADAGATP